jgi:cyclopropane-fatty-acyl-phospholipid synthase
MVLAWLCQRVVTYVLLLAGLEVGKDYTVNDPHFYRDVLFRGSLGLGESYMAGYWETPDLVDFFVKLCSNQPVARIGYWVSWCYPWEWFRTAWIWLWGAQDIEGAKEVGRKHYDLSPEMYEKMLDTPMQYSCGYWRGAETLSEAQIGKMELLARKLKLAPGQQVLDIGCGWGDLAIHLAKKYSCHVTGLTISAKQRETALERATNAGVADRVTILLEDYRQHQGTYDRIVSVGMLEHTQISNLPLYFTCVERLLRSGGIAVIHSIANRTNTDVGDPWISRYIFPNSAIPSYSAWVNALRQVPLEIEHIQNIGPDYARTLAAWRERFNQLCLSGLSETFIRMWNYYLTVCEAQFRIRSLNLWQMVLTKGRQDRYDLSC